MKNILVTAIISLFSISAFSQTDISGTWNTGDQNTVVKIEQVDGVYSGTIISSDNAKVKPGTLIIKELKNKKGKLEGKLFAIRKGKWYDAEFNHTDNNLAITISVGFRNKTTEWKKDSNNNR